MFPFAFQLLGLHHKLICIFDTMRLSTLHCLYWIWWVSTHLCISYHVSTHSLIWVPLRLFWCPFSALTSFLCLPVLVSDSPIPPALPLYNDCPFFLISKPFTPSNLFSMFLVLIFNPDTLYDVPVTHFQPQLPPASPSSLQWMPVLSCKYPVP